MKEQSEDEPIAIIGVAGRFPGAGDLDQFWANLCAGVESIGFPSDEQLVAAGVPRSVLTDPYYVKASAAPPDVDAFDAGLFRLTPREARICDPQTRLFLECAHAAMENAGYDHTRTTDVGVFGASGDSGYLDLVRRAEGAELGATSGMSLSTWSSRDYLAALVSYKLGLHGPSLGVMTACSSSLVAVHLAAASLRAGECAMALAGGAVVQLPLHHGYWWEPGGVLSRDGHCRPFDKAASGMVNASGAGVVALKRLRDALADGDHIRAVIRATALNNDGAAKVGFTAPSVGGQAAVIAEALSVAGVDPSDVSMVEAHASGSVLGDPIEVAALTSAFRRLGAAEPGTCALTSVKGNIGHLGHAAGVASLIKAALALENGVIPASVGLRELNPALGLDGSPFYVPTGPVPWPGADGRPRIAAVHSYGVGGTNAHAVLTQAPPVVAAPAPARPRIVVWSARTTPAADRYRERLAGHFARAATADFARATGTLLHGRTPHARRGAVVAADAREAVALLRDPGAAGHVSAPADGSGSRVAFLFPGSGAAQPGAARELYDSCPAFAKALDECADLFDAAAVPVRESWRDGDEDRLAQAPIAEPVVFTLEYALLRAWEAWGVTPDAVLGYGIGEFAAATAAGVLSLADAVRVVAARSDAVRRMPAGGMLAARAPAEQLLPLLPEQVAIAAVDGARQVVLAGPVEPLARAAAAMSDAKLPYRPLPGTHALYMREAAGAVPVLERVLSQVRLGAPQIDLVSAAAGRAITAAEAADPAFWAGQIAQPARFAAALDELTGQPDRWTLVEVGPGRTLTALARQHPTVVGQRHRSVSTLPARRTDAEADQRCVLTAVASVWTEGHSVDWTGLPDAEDTGRIPVPGYPYERQRYWVEQRQPARPALTDSAQPVHSGPGSAGPESAGPESAGPRSAGGPSSHESAGTVERLRLLWVALLGHDGITPDADFFDLGGNSLTAVELMARVRAEFGIHLSVDALFDHPTPAGLAGHLDGRAA